MVYSSCIIFTPDNNLVHRHYETLLRDSIPNVILGRPATAPGSVVLTGHDGAVFGVQRVSYSSAADLIVSAAANYGAAEIMVWDAKTGARLMSYTSKVGFAYCHGVEFLPGNKEIVSVWSWLGDSSLGQLWRLTYETGDLVCPPYELKGDGELNCIAWAPDWSSVLCGTKDGKIFRFSINTGLEIREGTQVHEGKINTLSFSPDGRTLVSTSADHSFKVWDATSEKLDQPTFTLPYWLEIYGASFCPTNPSLLAVAAGDALHIYDITTGTLDSERPQVGAFFEIRYSPDGKYIATRGFLKQHIGFSYREVRGGNAVIEGTILETEHTLAIGCLAFSPDQRHIVTGAQDQTLRVDKLEDAGVHKVVAGHQTEILDMAFTLDGKQCASLDDQLDVCLWDLEAGKLIEKLPPTDGLVGPITYTSDAQYILSGGKPGVIVGINLSTKEAHSFPIVLGFPVLDWTMRSLAMAPDDSSFAVLGSGWFEDVGQRAFLCFKPQESPPEVPAVTVDMDITSPPHKSRLAYHPSGKYLCCGDSVWELSVDPPALITGEKLPTILKETFLVSLDCSYDVENQPIITVGSQVLSTLTFGSPARQTLYIPSELLFSQYSVHDGCIALGSKDGRVTVLDFTHLLTPEETATLSRIRKSLSSYLCIDSTFL